MQNVKKLKVIKPVNRNVKNINGKKQVIMK